jgi:hypothetical protein
MQTVSAVLSNDLISGAGDLIGSARFVEERNDEIESGRSWIA